MSNMLMPAAPAAPAAITSAMFRFVMPPMASTGSRVAPATADSSRRPAAGRPGFEPLSKIVPKIR